MNNDAFDGLFMANDYALSRLSVSKWLCYTNAAESSEVVQRLVSLQIREFLPW